MVSSKVNIPDIKAQKKQAKLIYALLLTLESYSKIDIKKEVTIMPILNILQENKREFRIQNGFQVINKKKAIITIDYKKLT